MRISAHLITPGILFLASCMVPFPASALEPRLELSPRLELGVSVRASALASNDAGWTVVAWITESGRLGAQRYRHGEVFGAPADISIAALALDLGVAINRTGGIVLVTLENSCPVCSPPVANETFLYRLSLENEMLEEPRLLAFGTQPAIAMDDSGAFQLLAPGFGLSYIDLILERHGPVPGPPGEIVGVGASANRPLNFYDLAINAQGSTLAIWDEMTCGIEICRSQGLYGQLFQEPGSAAGAPFLIAERSVGASIESLPDGRFLVLWNEPLTSDLLRFIPLSVRARMISGSVLGEVMTVAPIDALGFGPVDWQVPGARPRVAVDSSGNAVALWMRQYEDGSFSGPILQPLNPAGGSFGAPRLLSEMGEGIFAGSAIGAEGPGTFLAIWQDASFVSSRLFGRRLSLIPPSGCVSSALQLCLLDARFEVSGSFLRPSGRRDTIRFQALGDGSGYGSFLRSGNAEVLVKMLDGRGSNGHFWFFSGGLSNVEYNLTVKDLQTGQIQEYRNPAGTLASFGDVQAFEGEAGPGAGRAAATATSPTRATTSSAPLPPTDCFSTETYLCVQQARFAVEVTWRDRAGGEGSGTAVPLSTDSGVFWFFRRDNPEVMVKVLDGRGVNGNFWVFYASATDLEFTLAMTDTETGETRVYENPQGTFASAADTRAFRP